MQIYVVGFTNERGFITKSPRNKAEALLKRMAEVTGGKAYFPQATNELNDIARDIASELRMQYLISYMPSTEKQDRAFHSIKVVVDDGPNKEKRIAITRTGRVAVKADSEPAPTSPTPKPKNQ